MELGPLRAEAAGRKAGAHRRARPHPAGLRAADRAHPRAHAGRVGRRRHDRAAADGADAGRPAARRAAGRLSGHRPPGDGAGAGAAGAADRTPPDRAGDRPLRPPVVAGSNTHVVWRRRWSCFDRFRVRQPRKRPPHFDADHRIGFGEKRFHGLEDVVLGGKGHLQIDLGELELTVRFRKSSSRKHRAIWKYSLKPTTIRSCLKICGTAAAQTRGRADARARESPGPPPESNA